MKWLLGIVLVTLVALGSGYLWVQNKLRSPIGSSDNKIILEVTRGKTLPQIFKELESNQITSDTWFLKKYARFNRLGATIKAGEYEVDSTLTPLALFSLLQSGQLLSRPLTIPEGYNIFEIADIFERQGLMKRDAFMSFVRDPKNVNELLGNTYPSLEGYLFPETYQVTRTTQGPELIRSMVRQFLAQYSRLEAEAARLDWPRHKVVTLASIIEKETGATWERPLISSVFHNRINKRMRLQTDPTVLYARALIRDSYQIKITREDLRRDHPYNTYRIQGLPPGPIANPGFEALKAVFYPETSDYLFFVSRNDGTHIFSKTYAEHNKAVNEYQRNPKARQGRSWRELNQRPAPANQPSIAPATKPKN